MRPTTAFVHKTSRFGWERQLGYLGESINLVVRFIVFYFFSCLFSKKIVENYFYSLDPLIKGEEASSYAICFRLILFFSTS